jgi:hypothetical protein
VFRLIALASRYGVPGLAHLCLDHLITHVNEVGSITLAFGLSLLTFAIDHARF